MKHDHDNPQTIIDALALTLRTGGWNNRPRTVQRFDLPNRWGHDPCRLYVVPYRRWAYRRDELQAADWQRQHGGAA